MQERSQVVKLGVDPFVVEVVPEDEDHERGQGTLTLILKGIISVGLTSLTLLVRNQLFQVQDKQGFFFIFKTT